MDLLDRFHATFGTKHKINRRVTPVGASEVCALAHVAIRMFNVKVPACQLHFKTFLSGFIRHAAHPNPRHSILHMNRAKLFDLPECFLANGNNVCVRFAHMNMP